MKFETAPKHEQIDHLYRCSECGEEVWYTVQLPERMTKGHRVQNIGRRCFGTLHFIRFKHRYPETLQHDNLPKTEEG